MQIKGLHGPPTPLLWATHYVSSVTLRGHAVSEIAALLGGSLHAVSCQWTNMSFCTLNEHILGRGKINNCYFTFSISITIKLTLGRPFWDEGSCVLLLLKKKKKKSLIKISHPTGVPNRQGTQSKCANK